MTRFIGRRASEALDYEGELGLVIGRRCRHVPRERAHKVIGGYMVVNDVSVRDWQRKSPTMTLGKSWDTHGPTGPWIVTPDEIGDPQRSNCAPWSMARSASTEHAQPDLRLLLDHQTLFHHMHARTGLIISTGTPRAWRSR